MWQLQNGVEMRQKSRKLTTKIRVVKRSGIPARIMSHRYSILITVGLSKRLLQLLAYYYLVRPNKNNVKIMLQI